MDEKAPLTIEQRIEILKNDIQKAEAEINNWREIGLKSQGALFVLEQILNETK